MLALLHRLFQFFLVVGEQSMNLVVRFVADSVNLLSKLLARSCRASSFGQASASGHFADAKMRMCL